MEKEGKEGKELGEDERRRIWGRTRGRGEVGEDEVEEE